MPLIFFDFISDSFNVSLEARQQQALEVGQEVRLELSGIAWGHNGMPLLDGRLVDTIVGNSRYESSLSCSKSGVFVDASSNPVDASETTQKDTNDIVAKKLGKFSKTAPDEEVSTIQTKKTINSEKCRVYASDENVKPSSKAKKRKKKESCIQSGTQFEKSFQNLPEKKKTRKMKKA